LCVSLVQSGERPCDPSIYSRKIRNKCANDPFFQQFSLNWNSQEGLVEQNVTVVLCFLLNFTYFIHEGIKNRLADITSFRVSPPPRMLLRNVETKSFNFCFVWVLNLIPYIDQ
jgi:hypothetical protein